MYFPLLWNEATFLQDEKEVEKLKIEKRGKKKDENSFFFCESLKRS